MGFIVLGAAAIIFLAMGISYYRFCMRVSESFLNIMADDRTIQEEGGDNWPCGSIRPADIISGRHLSDSEKEMRVKRKERSPDRRFSCVSRYLSEI